MKYDIHMEIDCAPGTPRPDTYYPKCLDAIGVKVTEVPEADSKFFGNWEWNVTVDLTVDENPEVLRDRIKAVHVELYESGHIRYGSIAVSKHEDAPAVEDFSPLLENGGESEE